MSETRIIGGVTIVIDTGSVGNNETISNSIGMLGRTTEFRALLERASNNTAEITILDASLSPAGNKTSYAPETGNLYINIDHISRAGYQSEPRGDYYKTSLERTLVHEISHAAMHPTGAPHPEPEALRYTNNFMAKYFSEPTRYAHSPPYTKLFEVAPSLLTYSSQNRNSEYKYEGPGDNMTDYLDSVINARSLLDSIKEFFTEGFSIDPTVSDLFDMSQNWRPPIRPIADPLVFDLDHDGVETTAISDWDSTQFDHNADGQRSGTGWVHPDDALLVMDLNDNGTIDSGRELFGDSTLLRDGSTAADGFEALAELDSNQDGKIDENDSDFTKLRLWQDKNQDGISQTDELTTLEQQGIIAISTASTAQGTFQNGNLITASGEYQKSDGSTADVGNLLFARSDFFTDFVDIAIPDSHQNIINLNGSGQVRGLQQAATLSAPLPDSEKKSYCI